jgi:hypothetical protein
MMASYGNILAPQPLVAASYLALAEQVRQGKCKDAGKKIALQNQ